MKHRVIVVTVAGLLAATGVAAAQSLGDVARREAERRKTAPPAGKVYTGDTLRPDPLSRPATPAQPEAPAAAAAPSQSGGEAPAAGDAPQEPDPKGDEKQWRGRIQAERDALQRAEIFAEALQSRINALSADFSSRDDPAQRSQVASDRQRALAEMDRVKQEIAQHTANIATIQEEARRAGVPAGWVR